MSTSCSRMPNYAITRSSATTTPVPLTRAASKATQNVVYVENASTATTSCTRTAEISTSAVTSATVATGADSSSTMSTTIRSRYISRKITSCAQIGSAWRRSLSCSIQKWI